MTEADAEERLDDALDQLARGRLSRLNGHAAPELRAAIRLRALSEDDPGAAPRADFLPALRRELLMTRVFANNPSQPLPGVPPRTSARTAALPRKLRPVAWFSFALLLALIAAGVYLTASGGGERGPEKRSLPAAAVSTPGIMAALPEPAVDISECTTTARPDGTVARLIGQTPEDAPLLPKLDSEEKPGDPSTWADPNALLGGHPKADAAQLAGITRTIRELTACRFYFNPVSTWKEAATPTGEGPTESAIGLDGRLYALFSDDYFRKDAVLWTGGGVRAPALTVYWIARGPFPWRVDDARQLADGRVIATAAAPPGSVYFTRVVVIFSEHDGRWLIDEFGTVAYRSAGRDYPQYLDIALQNNAGPSKAIPIPSVDGFRNTRPTTVTVANLGDVDQRFVIDRLGVDLVVPAGHSVSFALTPAAGKYVVEAYSRNPATGNFDEQFRDLQYVLTVVGPGTPVAMG